MESLESRGYTIQDQLSKGQYTSVLTAYSSLYQSKVAVKLLPPTDVKCSLFRSAALGSEWMFDLPTEVTAFSKSHYGGLVAQRLGRWIRDRKIHGSVPSRCTTYNNNCGQVVHTHLLV